MIMNKPYVKQYNENGLVSNPITKDNPYISKSENRSTRRYKPGREMSNKKGIQLVVTYIGRGKFLKTIKRRNADGSVTYIEKQPKQKQRKK